MSIGADPIVSPSLEAMAKTNEPPEEKKGGTRHDIKYAFKLIGRYFRADPTFGTALILANIVIGSGSSYLILFAQEKLAAITNALAAKDAGPIAALGMLVILAGMSYLVAHAVADLCKYVLRMRARTRYTDHFLKGWLGSNRFYRMEQSGKVDHPEQRIQEDVYAFIEHTLSIGPGLITGLTPLFLYSGKLWNLSQPISLDFIGLPYEIQGGFFFAAAGFAIFWTFVTHLFGSGLTKAEVVRQGLEAQFRHQMAALRENSESVAFERGVSAERGRLEATFELIRKNWRRYTASMLQVNLCTGFPGMAFMAVPTLLCAPYVLSGRMKLGDIQLITVSFQIVFMSFGIFVQSYATLAILRSAVARLRFFEECLSEQVSSEISQEDGDNSRVSVRNLQVNFPDGSTMVDVGNLSFSSGDRVLIKGKSGAGKSSLLRAVAGLWPYGKGVVQMPPEARVCFLPQRAYMPDGTLATLLCYPLAQEQVSEDLLRELLRQFDLAKLIPRLHDFASWRRVLSPGEQQRVAAARAIINRPDFLFIDEATSALDSQSEATLYSLLEQHLPSTALISVAHRKAVEAFHVNVLKISEGRAVLERLDAGKDKG